MNMQFSKATKLKARLRLALIGLSGGGKTFTALTIAKFLGGKTAVIDTEHGSASKYANLFDFDVLELSTFSPLTYVEAIEAAERAGYKNLIIDSLSHAWMGKEGALEQVDRAAKRSQSQNTYTAWRDVTPQHNALIDTMIQSDCNLIVTMRAKTDYIMEPNEKGKMAPRKIGLAPVQRDGLEYEFDVVADMDVDNNMIVSKSRCPALNGYVVNKPGKDIADRLMAWLTDGSNPPPPEPVYSPDWEALWPIDAKVSLEMAKTIKTGEKPFTPYLETPVDTLAHMINSIDKTIQANGLTAERRDELSLKRDTIQIILSIYAKETKA